jgi:DNA helicase-2/ATP-dependent DNA helicase PcrA
MTFKPTEQQQAFLDALANTTDNIALVARAGCGKTSTILMGVDALVARNPHLEIGVCAFNKAIADEVSGKLQQAGHTNWKTVQASTLHSMGFGLLKFLFRPTIDDQKVRNLTRASENPICQVYGREVEQLVCFAKQAAFGFFPDKRIEDVRAWYELAERFDVDGFDDPLDAEALVGAAQEVYRAGLRITDKVDFDDMILLPLVLGLRVKFTKDVLFMDEAQDLSPARQALARKFVRPGTGRMIIVGDDRQAIYGFTGADSEALPNMIAQLRAKVLPLSVTWRCPKSVVRYANRFVPDIQAAPEAPAGEVLSVNTKEGTEALLESLGAEDAILCRNTAPLIQTAYKLIRSGKPCKVEGRAIGNGLIALAQRWKVKGIDALLNRLEVYKQREIQKALAKNNEAKAEEVSDRVETLVEICKECIKQGNPTVADVVDFINSLFADGVKGVTTLATYHRSKGREWPRVILIEHSTRCPSKGARQPWQLEQEDNLAYVAFTRAQRTLVFWN